ncbi:MAG: RNA methyltransferase [Bacteroidales bacterium]|nr:RNA methyltransferase [Bacteroidales bacterium]
MEKRTTEQLGRLSVEEYRQAPKVSLSIILDNIRSLNNIGSIFRTSDAFRVERIYLCGITATPPHRDIHKTALGAEESVEWQYCEDTCQCVSALKAQGTHVYALEQVHDSIMLDQLDETPLSGPVAIVFGNEIDGVQQEVVDLCDGCIEIPQFGTKHSLNVSCAGAIIIWELFKKLHKQ